MWVEEFGPPAGADLQNLGLGAPPVLAVDGEVFGGAASGQVWGEYVRVEDAETVATFTDGALTGWPAVTRRKTGDGAGWYVATLPEPDALRRLAERIAGEAGIELPSPAATGGQVETVRRGGSLFVINHGEDDAEILIDGTDALTGAPTSGMRLPPQGVAIIGTPLEGDAGPAAP